MPPMWWKLLKIILVLFALFTTIVCINSEITKRREAEAAAATAAPATAIPIDTTTFMSENLLGIMRSKARNQDEKKIHQQQQDQQTIPLPSKPPNTVRHELPAEDIDERIHSIFKVSGGEGVLLFNTTTFADDAPFMPMPIPTTLGDQSPTATASEQLKPSNKPQSQSQQQSLHYHQYHSLNHEEQSFKVQRSPDGKLNLVFTDPLISLQAAQQPQPQQQPQQQPHQQPQQPLKPRQPPSDSKSDGHRPVTKPTIDTHQCLDNFNQSRTFCTVVNNYPDLSGLKNELLQKFPNLFIDEQPPTEVGLRMQDDELHLCNSRTSYVYPKLGQKLDQTWQYIVNSDELKQGVLIEECEGKDESCSFLDSFPQNYTPVCKQHFMIKQLVTINNATGQAEAVNEAFKIPSCCKCVLRPKALSGS